MGRKEIITTIEGRENAPLSLYQFPPDAGSFIGTLVYREWHRKKPCLVCYFDTDNGEHFKLMAWFNRGYAPRKSTINFADDVENGGKWKCEFERSKGGSVTWLTAEQCINL